MRVRVQTSNLPEWREVLCSAAAPERFEILTDSFSEATLSGKGYDLALPFRLEEYELIQRVPEAASRALIPNERHRRLADDKLAFAQWLSATGFGRNVPAFAIAPVMGFPLIRKRRTGANGKHCRLYFDGSALLRDSTTTPDEGYFFQQCVQGRIEYATHTISLAGIVLFMGTTASVHDTDLFVKGNGEIPRSISRHENVAENEIRSIISALGYTGYACFDYKLEGGVPMFFEMNPRIGYSSYLYADAFLDASLHALRRRPFHSAAGSTVSAGGRVVSP